MDRLKALARCQGLSTEQEQEVRELLDGHTAERQSVLSQIEEIWAAQTQRPTADEIDGWMGIGRS